MKSLPPGFVSRVLAVILAGAVVILLQDDLAQRRSDPSPASASADVEPTRPPLLAAEVDDDRAETREGEPELTAMPASSTPIVERADASPAPPQRVNEELPTRTEKREIAVEEPTERVAMSNPADVTPAGPAEVAEAEPVQSPVRATAACWQVAELYEAEDNASAQREARVLLETFGGATEVTAALIAEGVPTHRARLLTVLTLHAAGEADEARELARRTRAGHADNEEVAESLRRWSILRPRITEFTSFVNERQRLVIRGVVHNDDIGAVRKVKVRGEALDEDGNVIAAIETRVKPRLIAADLAGEFEILFKNIADHERVTRTRATVIGFEYEVVASR